MTDKQLKFCNEYLKDFNGSRAYKATYSCKTDETAYVNASRLLRNAKVAQYIEERKKKQQEKAIITQEMILLGLKDILQDEKECTGNKLKAMELAGKHLGMFKETNMNVNLSYEDYLNKVADDDEY
jgi:phage terminase small subunit